MSRLIKSCGLRVCSIGLVLLSVACGLALVARAAPPQAAAPKPASRPSVDEARARALILQETVLSTLKVIHHEYYREDEKLPIPARVFRKVFDEIAEKQKVELRWLAITGQAMNVAHNPRTDFEREAAEVIAGGADDFEAVSDGIYRRVGAIPLTSECLKCHAPNRTDVKTRKAGLVIWMPVAEGK